MKPPTCTIHKMYFITNLTLFHIEYDLHGNQHHIKKKSPSSTVGAEFNKDNISLLYDTVLALRQVP